MRNALRDSSQGRPAIEDSSDPESNGPEQIENLNTQVAELTTVAEKCKAAIRLCIMRIEDAPEEEGILDEIIGLLKAALV